MPAEDELLALYAKASSLCVDRVWRRVEPFEDFVLDVSDDDVRSYESYYRLL